MESNVGIAVLVIVAVAGSMLLVGMLANDSSFALRPELDWGLSTAEVREYVQVSYPEDQLLEEGDQYLIYGGKLSRQKAVIYYQFEEEGLVAVKYGFFYGTGFEQIERELQAGEMELSYSSHASQNVSIREKSGSGSSIYPSLNNGGEQMPSYEVSGGQVPRQNIWEGDHSVVHHYQSATGSMHALVYLDKKYNQQLMEAQGMWMNSPFDELKPLREKYDRGSF